MEKPAVTNGERLPEDTPRYWSLFLYGILSPTFVLLVNVYLVMWDVWTIYNCFIEKIWLKKIKLRNLLKGIYLAIYTHRSYAK